MNFPHNKTNIKKIVIDNVLEINDQSYCILSGPPCIGAGTLEKGGGGWGGWRGSGWFKVPEIDTVSQLRFAHFGYLFPPELGQIQIRQIVIKDMTFENVQMNWKVHHDKAIITVFRYFFLLQMNVHFR